MHFVLILPLFAILLLACWSDLRERRIPNLYTGPGILLALLIRGAMGGEALLDGVGGVLAMLAVGLLLLASGGFGGGDAKLMIMVGAFLGLSQVVEVIVAISLCGALVAGGLAWWHGLLPVKLVSAARLGLFYVTLGRRGERPASTQSQELGFAYAVPIALGTLLTSWL